MTEFGASTAVPNLTSIGRQINVTDRQTDRLQTDRNTDTHRSCLNPVCLVSVAAIKGTFIRRCNTCAYGLTAARRAGPSMQTLGPLLQYTGCTKQRYTSYRGYFTILIKAFCGKNKQMNSKIFNL